MDISDVSWGGIVIGIALGIIVWGLKRAVSNNDDAIKRNEEALQDLDKKNDARFVELEKKVDLHHSESRERLYNNHLDMLNKLNEVSLKLEKINIKSQ